MRRVAVVMMALGTALGVVAPEAGGTEFPGTAVLAGRAKLKVQSCGKATDAAVVDVIVAADGAWTIDDGMATYAGTGLMLGKAGRKLALTLDESSLASLVATLEADAGTLCGVAVTATGVTMRKALLKVNRKGTRARLVVLLKGLGTTDDGTSGKAKYRVIATGPWIGPRSCEETFTCTRACATDDQSCVEACLEQATLATQEGVEALTACIVAACPSGDGLCVATALAGACAVVYEACVPPPPPTDLTCEEIFDCTAGCGGQRCIDDCFDRGSERGRDEATAVSGCVNRVCPGGGTGCQATAIAGACAYVWQDCTGTPPPQNLGCGAILDCLGTCAVGDSACGTDCRSRGSVTGESKLAALETCVDAACPTRDPLCVSGTVTGQCQLQWQSCVG